MGSLQISETFAFPLDAVTETFVILAKRGSGKTYTAADRHKKAGEEPCAACKHGESEYQAEQFQKRRRRAEGVA